MQMCKLLGKAVMLVITLHLISSKGKLTFKNEIHTGRQNKLDRKYCKHYLDQTLMEMFFNTIFKITPLL